MLLFSSVFNKKSLFFAKIKREAKKLLFVNYHPIIDAAEAYIAENSRTYQKRDHEVKPNASEN